MENLINKIHNCDNREILKQISDKSVQVFLEDMPYNTTDCKFEYKIDLTEYWKLRLSKIKDNGTFILCGSQPFTTDLINSNRKIFKYEIIWEKNTSTGFLNAKNKPLKNHENILILSLGNTNHINLSLNRMIYNPQDINRVNKISKHTKNKFGNITGNRPSHKKEFITEFENFPKTVIKYNSEKNCFHPTQKPVPLFEYLIKTYTNENDLIFDGFSGSGTTAIACQKLKRNFICCELDKTYYDKSIERLNIELEKNKIF